MAVNVKPCLTISQVKARAVVLVVLGSWGVTHDSAFSNGNLVGRVVCTCILLLYIEHWRVTVDTSHIHGSFCAQEAFTACRFSPSQDVFIELAVANAMSVERGVVCGVVCVHSGNPVNRLKWLAQFSIVGVESQGNRIFISRTMINDTFIGYYNPVVLT